MDVGAGLCMHDFVVKSSRSLSHRLMSFLSRASVRVSKALPCLVAAYSFSMLFLLHFA